MKVEYTIKNLTELSLFAKQVLAALSETKSPKRATVIALSGELGAGKTTFVQTLALKLGVEEVVTSPTFAILKMYDTANPDFSQLFHMDAYRIDDLGELGPLRFSELLTIPNALFCIEWAGKITPALPALVVTIHLSSKSDETRVATVEGLVLNARY